MMIKIVSLILLTVLLLIIVPLPAFAQDTGFHLVPCGRSDQQSDPANAQCTLRHFFVLIYRLVNYLISAAGIVAMYHVLLAGFTLVTSLGNPEKIQSAKTGISNAVVGFAMVILSFMFVNLLINGIFGMGDPAADRKWWHPKCLYDITAGDGDECPQDLTPAPVGAPPPAQVFVPPGGLKAKVQAAAAAKGLDYCYSQSFAEKESSWKADAIGHDHSPASDKFSSASPPKHALDWKNSHGIGLYQITIFPNTSGWLDSNTPAREIPDGAGQKYTVLQLLNADTNITLANGFIAQLVARKNGDFQKAAAAFNGSGALAAAYGEDIMDRAQKCNSQVNK